MGCINRPVLNGLHVYASGSGVSPIMHTTGWRRLLLEQSSFLGRGNVLDCVQSKMKKSHLLARSHYYILSRYKGAGDLSFLNRYHPNAVQRVVWHTY